MKDLFKANEQLLQFCQFFSQMVKKIPIRPSEMGVLNIICNVPGAHTPVALATQMGVSRPMISAHINSLVKSGYIVRVSAPTDGRSSYVLPTKKAMTLVAAVRGETNDMMKHLQSRMGEKNFDDLIRLLDMACNVLEQK